MLLKTYTTDCWYVWSIVMYGCETWTIRDSERKRLEAFRNVVLKIKWKNRITNEEVLERFGE